MTNDRELSSTEVLQAHKSHPMIEKRFEQVKTVHQIAPIFLKNEGPIEALFTLYFLALLVQGLTERELRLAMQRENITELPLYPEQRDCEITYYRTDLKFLQPSRTAQALPGRTHPPSLQGRLHRPPASVADPARRLRTCVSAGKASQLIHAISPLRPAEGKAKNTQSGRSSGRRATAAPSRKSTRGVATGRQLNSDQWHSLQHLFQNHPGESDAVRDDRSERG
jgi:hypothetical protein